MLDKIGAGIHDLKFRLQDRHHGLEPQVRDLRSMLNDLALEIQDMRSENHGLKSAPDNPEHRVDKFSKMYEALRSTMLELRARQSEMIGKYGL